MDGRGPHRGSTYGQSENRKSFDFLTHYSFSQPELKTGHTISASGILVDLAFSGYAPAIPSRD
jgi:hypothetical protein